MPTRRHLLAALPPLLAAPTLARAAFPDRPVRLVVPFAAGGGTDVLARILAQGLTERLGQQVVVENRTGAGGNLAMENVVRSAPDGYSVLMGTNGAVAVNRHLYRGMGFDPLRDLMPVALAFRIEHLMAVGNAVPARDIASLVAYARANPGALTFASGGTGSMIHLAGELFKARTGIDITHVPYRGGGPAMNDLVAGTVSMMFDSLPSAAPQVQAGRARAFALCGTRRHPLFPDLPTVAETAVPDYQAASTGGLFLPLNTPGPVVRQLDEAIASLVANPNFRQILARSGGDAEHAGPAALAEMMARESEGWGTIVRDAGITA